MQQTQVAQEMRPRYSGKDPGQTAAGTAYSEAPKEARNEAPKGEKHHFNSVPTRTHWERCGNYEALRNRSGRLIKEKLPDDTTPERPGRDQTAAPCMLPKDPEQIRAPRLPDQIPTTHGGEAFPTRKKMAAKVGQKVGIN